MDAHIVKEPGRLKIDGEMTIYAANELRDELFPYLHGANEAIELDLSGVTALDTAGLQILFMLKRIATEKGVACRPVNASPAVLEIVELCRLQKMLGFEGSGSP